MNAHHNRVQWPSRVGERPGTQHLLRQARQFTSSNVTTYSGAHGSILGPWAISQWIDTIDGTSAGAVVAGASVLSNGGQDFSIWLRHR
jgi:hypothetical protein